MTNPPPSPYGPGSPTPTSSSSQPAMFRPPEAPYGYTVVGPTPPKQGNGLGLAALILGIAAIVTAFVPIINFFAYVLGGAGIIVGIIGLVLAGRPRRAAAWGTALSAVSMVIATVMIVVYTVAFFTSVDRVVDEATERIPERSMIPVPPERPGVPGDVLPLGTWVLVDGADNVPVYEVTVMASALNSDAAVMAVEGNPAPPAGMQWAMAEIAVYALGDLSSPAVDLAVEYIDAVGIAHTPADAPAVAPGVGLDTVVDLEPGLGAVAFVVIAIPTEDPAGGHWSIGLDGTGAGNGERFLFAAE